jgi:Ni/Co efflux regulator RcnB
MRSVSSSSRGIALLLVCLAASGAALADKPSWAGSGGKPGKPHAEERGRDDRDARAAIDLAIGARDRRIIVDYYQAQARAGHCPPGLAKKRNGCLPPGQAKKWALGQPLPADLVYHDLPRDLLVRLPAPPAGHRYVQVAADILLIAVGTSMVVDAVQDLMR